MAKYRIILNRFPMQEERIGGFYWPEFSLTEELLSQQFCWLSGKFCKIFPFTIRLVYLGSCLVTLFACLQRHLSPNKWLNSIPKPNGKRDIRPLVKLVPHLPHFRQHVLEKPSPQHHFSGLNVLREHSQHSAWNSLGKGRTVGV